MTAETILFAAIVALLMAFIALVSLLAMSFAQYEASHEPRD